MEVDPNKLASMHRLHERMQEFQRPRSGRSARSSLSSPGSGRTSVPSENLSDDVINSTWGANGTWQVIGQLPYRAGEPHEPVLSARTFEIWPEITDKRRVGRRSNVSVAGRQVKTPEAVMEECGVGVCNTKGRKEADDDVLFGQDNFSVTRLQNGWEVFCIMDGHGHEGHWPATRACRILPHFLQAPSAATMLAQGQVEAALHYAFDHTQAHLEEYAEEARVMLEISGCSALCCLWNRGQSSLWVATAGDTRAALLVPGQGVVASTADHNPSLVAERRRIEESGGEIRICLDDDGEEDCHDVDVVERVYVKGEEFPGLAMTRSLGDMICKAIGVTHVPEVVKWSLVDRPGAVLLAACDGLWDFLDTDEVGKETLNLLAAGWSPQAVVNKLLDLARDSWTENAEDYTDDITILLVPVPSTGGVTHLLTRAEVPETRCSDGLCRSGCSVS